MSGVKSPATYGDYYWSQQVEAALWLDETIEETLSGQIRSLVSKLGISENVPDNLKPLLSKLIEPTSPGYGAIMGRFVSEAADGILGQSMNHALKDFNYKMASWFKDQRIDFTTASTLFQRKAITEGMFDARREDEGYKKAEGAAYYLSRMPYPSIPDIMLHARYHSDPYNIRGKVWESFDVPTRDFALWEWLGLQRLTTEQIHAAFRRGYIPESDLLYKLGEVGWSKDDAKLLQDVNWQIPNAMLMVQGGLMEGLGFNEILRDITFADIHPKYKSTYLNAVLTKPAPTDLVAFELRKDPSLTGLSRQLQRIGIHPDYTDIYETLAYPIPPVADIITMAVREAFTPAIAARFGQYEDFPADFAKYAAQKGLSREWAERYWAAHWSLPSPQQGFEMLHRGIVNEVELLMLMKALDIMPFWRDKLMQMSYKRLTRVDVRRMYREGVLDEREVYESYLSLGYDETNAGRMSEFTIKQTLSSLSKFTVSDVTKAYTQRKIDKAETISLLRMLGIRSDDINFLVSTADYKREWALTDAKISGIRNLYKKRVYDANQTRDKLSRLNLPSEQIDAYMEQWYYDIAAEPTPTWTTAQTIAFVKKGIITLERAKQELRTIGYDAEHINAYVGLTK